MSENYQEQIVQLLDEGTGERSRPFRVFLAQPITEGTTIQWYPVENGTKAKVSGRDLVATHDRSWFEELSNGFFITENGCELGLIVPYVRMELPSADHVRALFIARAKAQATK